MQCPYCGQDHDKVVDSRSSEGGKAVRRRRQCLSCDRRFTTYERAEESVRLSVIKKDSSREPYERQKLINGLQKSCYKRPVTAEQILNIVDLTEEEIFRNYDRDVPSQFIGDTASYHLAKLDKIAYVRFASVYREFQDVGQLINEAEVIKNTPKVGPQQDGLFTDV
ncbi:MAG: transcriptional regulator NrdR [Phycisphaerae bacterium]